MEVREEKEELVAGEFSLTLHHNVVLKRVRVVVSLLGDGYYNLILQLLLWDISEALSTLDGVVVTWREIDLLAFFLRSNQKTNR